MWGIIPAMGGDSGSRRIDTHHLEGSSGPLEFYTGLAKRMITAGADHLCFVVSPGSSELMQQFGGEILSTKIFYAVQDRPAGLCDAIFRVLPIIAPEEHICVIPPNASWMPEDGILQLPDGILSMLLFPANGASQLDVVVTDDDGAVLEIKANEQRPDLEWNWGALKMPAATLVKLHQLWLERRDDHPSALIDEYVKRGGAAYGFKTQQHGADVTSGDAPWRKEKSRGMSAVHGASYRELHDRSATRVGYGMDAGWSQRRHRRSQR